MVKDIIRLIRPYHWVKNLFVFLPLFFDKRITDFPAILSCLVVFGSFCAISSCIYCINDIIDSEYDKLHPEKRHRPVASGNISKTAAFLIASLLFLISFALIFCFSPARWNSIISIVIAYFLLNIAYCTYLKKKAIVDVFCIAFGFVLRILAGGISTNVSVSQWIIMMTFILSLFLAFAKRRDDVLKLEEGIKVRDSINHYSLSFLNQTLSVLASITMVCYIMYTVSDEVVKRIGSSYLFTTSVFVLAGIIRYLQIAIVDLRSGSPTKILLKDSFLQFCIIGWIIEFAILLYL